MNKAEWKSLWSRTRYDHEEVIRNSPAGWRLSVKCLMARMDAELCKFYDREVKSYKLSVLAAENLARRRWP
jgi:23S rRNA G2445 N2-methylase RlmL